MYEVLFYLCFSLINSYISLLMIKSKNTTMAVFFSLMSIGNIIYAVKLIGG